MKALYEGVLAVAAGIVGYKWWKGKQLGAASYSLSQGHTYAVAFGFSGAGTGQPMASADLQTALNSTQGGQLFTVQGNPSIDLTHKILGASVIYNGSTGAIPASSFTGGFPSAYGTITVRQMLDTGSPLFGLESEADNLLNV